MAQFLGGLGGLAATAAATGWLMVSFGTAAIKDDVGTIRNDLNSIRTSLESATNAFKSADKDGIVRLGDAERRLADQISGLRTDLGGLRSDLSSTSKAMFTLRDQLGDFQKQLAVRQVNFGDPKVMQYLADALVKAGVDGSKIVIVPIDPASIGTEILRPK